MEGKFRWRNRAIASLAMLAFGSFLLLPVRAVAVLGGNVASIAADQQQMKAKREIRTTPNYTVHEITTPYGTVVREYADANGRVFAVAWRGPFLPNLQQLLGSYYERFAQGAQEARAEEAGRSQHAPLTVQRPDLVVHSGGHRRAYVGQAYIPEMVPQGVEPGDIQ